VTALALRPTRSEARVMFLGFVTFWTALGCGASLLASTPADVPVFLCAFPALLASYAAAFRVAGRERGLSAWTFYAGGRGDDRGVLERASDRWRVMLRLIDPRWWHGTLAPATGWPVVLVDSLIVLGLVVCILGTTVFAQPLPSQ
jgi:hypothetical protein